MMEHENTEQNPLLGAKTISNVNVLTVTSLCFALFVAAELIGALVSDSSLAGYVLNIPYIRSVVHCHCSEMPVRWL